MDPAMAAWNVLTDIESWPNWMPGIRAVDRVDNDDPGRGSLIQLHHTGFKQQWTIAHWEPSNRIDFIVHSHGGRAAFSYSLKTVENHSQLHLALDAEFELEGFRKLFAPLLSWTRKRRTRRYLANLRIRLLSTTN
jgi:hypothetical protein